MKKQLRNDPFVNLLLDEEEQALEDAFEKGEYEENTQLNNTKKILAEAATRHLELNSSKPITIRINQLDLIKVKARAKAKQIPYQTLLGSLIHLYAEGKKDFKL